MLGIPQAKLSIDQLYMCTSSHAAPSKQPCEGSAPMDPVAAAMLYPCEFFQRIPDLFVRTMGLGGWPHRNASNDPAGKTPTSCQKQDLPQEASLYFLEVPPSIQHLISQALHLKPLVEVFVVSSSTLVDFAAMTEHVENLASLHVHCRNDSTFFSYNVHACLPSASV